MLPRSLRWVLGLRCILGVGCVLGGGAHLAAQEVKDVQAAPRGVNQVLQARCGGCHSGSNAKGGLDLAALPWRLQERANRERWIRLHDRVERQEMPPKGVPFAAEERAGLLAELAPRLAAADLEEVRKQGRGPMRRLNREEYEENLRSILQLPRLDIKDLLPPDREAHHFNKVGETLDISRVQLTAYLDAAEAALRQAMVTAPAPPPVSTVRLSGRNLFPGVRSTGTLRSMFFLKGNRGVHVASEYGTPMPKELEEDPALEMGLFRSPGWPYGAFPRGYAAPHAGLYRVQFSARAVLQHPGYVVTEAQRPVPMTLRSRRPTNHDIAEDTKNVTDILEIQPGSHVYEVVVPLAAGQTVEYALLGLPVPQVDAEGKTGSYRYPPMPPEGQPGVAFHWISFTGPLPEAGVEGGTESWPPASHRVLFDGLGVNPQPARPQEEATRLMVRFARRASRGVAAFPQEGFTEKVQPFVRLIHRQLAAGEPFAEAMLSGYQAFLASDQFLYLREPKALRQDTARKSTDRKKTARESPEKPGSEERGFSALADRLSHLLTNTRPDAELVRANLEDLATLRRQSDRLIDSPAFDRFVGNFTNYWLNLRQLRRDDPDKRLYPEYQLDEYLLESMERETRAYVRTLVRENLPVTALVQSDFAFVNERLAKHYELPPVAGASLLRVALPPGSVRGGLLTQGAILKVTANGTATSPVIRGAWIMDRIVGQPPPPPPPGVPAVEPDIRGARTIRELLALHTKSATCASCHAKFDPVGLALESFDVAGHYRTHYRGTAEGQKVTGIDHTGHDYTYTLAGPVDASGRLETGERFANVQQLKALLAAKPRQLARNLVQQFTVYGTGTPVRFADRAEVERILDGCAPAGYRVRDLLHGLIGSRIFRGEAR